LRALQRRGSTGGRPRPRNDRSVFEDVRRFGSDDAVAGAVGEVSDVTDALSRDECRLLLLLTDERVTTAVDHNH